MQIKNGIKVVVLAALTTQLFAADFVGNLERLMGKNAEAYAMPVVQGFGSSLNAGLYKKASVSAGKLIPFGFDIGIVGIATVIPDDKTEFEHNLTDFTFDFHLTSEGEELENITLSFADIYNTSADVTPNIAGEDDGVRCTLKSEDEIFQNVAAKLRDADVSQQVIDTKEDNIRDYIDETMDEDYSTFSFPKGLGVKTLGAMSLQANVRLPLVGLEVTGRYLPEFELGDDLGKVNLYGIGVRKSLPVPIVDVTAGLFLQKLKIGNFFDLDTRVVHAEVGKSIGIPFLFNFSPYAGVGYSQTEVNLDYTMDGGTVPGIDNDRELNYSITPDDQFILTAGMTAQIVPLTYLNLEVNQSDYLTAVLKFGLILK